MQDMDWTPIKNHFEKGEGKSLSEPEKPEWLCAIENVICHRKPIKTTGDQLAFFMPAVISLPFEERNFNPRKVLHLLKALYPHKHFDNMSTYASICLALCDFYAVRYAEESNQEKKDEINAYREHIRNQIESSKASFKFDDKLLNNDASQPFLSIDLYGHIYQSSSAAPWANYLFNSIPYVP